jgi:uncharacterized protein involved in exopolysaccharide biosynthesis
VFQYERLQRTVRIREQVYTTLQTQFEEAKIQEINDTPVITVIDQAIPPQRRSSPKRKRLVIVVAAFSFLITLMTAFLMEAAERAKNSAHSNYQEFEARLRTIRGDLRKTFRRN